MYSTRRDVVSSDAVDKGQRSCPLTIASWDLERDLNFLKGDKTSSHCPAVGDIVYISNVVLHIHTNELKCTTRRQCSKFNVLLHADEARRFTRDRISAALMQLGRTYFGRYSNSFIQAAVQLTVDLKKWVHVINHNQSMCPTPQLVADPMA